MIPFYISDVSFVAKYIVDTTGAIWGITPICPERHVPKLFRYTYSSIQSCPHLADLCRKPTIVSHNVIYSPIVSNKSFGIALLPTKSIVNAVKYKAEEDYFWRTLR